ncbi:FecCD family ABC transporter permease [Dictyoglomus thermophilum]|uniref:ABC-type cobalamin/Fe3+-siderophores transport system, permease component n=1 Tax=Dictyoglomus thermophilum (strain ATCC 35947 / DSM 3960 / H-6-12) TaxID=309799 RepID=B5YCC0_DICT6|nr:iron ABC transporter permease [Dictyoglomus thermophilum]ACI18505.1 ABC-type cobalamin/Fe3+-siderophores transport system, permease component [Dictyoglomus thermophilum H-6-12]
MEQGITIKKYKEYTAKKFLFIFLLIFLIIVFSIVALNIGSSGVNLLDFVKLLIGKGDDRLSLIVWQIRIPRVIGAILAGVGLGVAGCISQSVLRNPMASPFTLGISQGAALGVTLSVVLFRQTLPYLTSLFAFLGAMMTTLLIILISSKFKVTPEAMILTGVSLSSLFSALTTIIQYFADELKIATVVFWTFGDIGRVSLREIRIIFVVVVLGIFYFLLKRWDYNALESGAETAKSLGVNVERERIVSMLVTSLISAVITAGVGVIGFVGLISPHIVRRFVGNDYRFLIPASALFGGLLLLLADTLARTIISPIVLPVGAITSLLGAPFFLYLLSVRFRR